MMVDVTNAPLIKFKSNLMQWVRSFLDRSGAVEVVCDKITKGTGSCENVPTIWKLEGDEFFAMSQTDQLFLEEMILKGEAQSVYTMGRSFRKEPRVGDGRHLAEFLLCEYECSGMKLDGLVSFQNDMLKMIILDMLNNSDTLLSLITQEHIDKLKSWAGLEPFPVVTYTDVIKNLQDKGVSISWGDDFSSRDEEMICAFYDGPVQVTYYPESLKFFNMYVSKGHREERISVHNNQFPMWGDTLRTTVDCVDFLLPNAGETFGGSRRETRRDIVDYRLNRGSMVKQLEEVGGDRKAFDSYLSLFRHDASRDRSGFGLGMGRLAQFLLGKKQVIPF